MMKAAVAALMVVSVASAAPAVAGSHGGPNDPTTEVCGGYNLGMTQDQIVEGLRRNDARIDYWQAWRDTAWPIIEGECG